MTMTSPWMTLLARYARVYCIHTTVQEYCTHFHKTLCVAAGFAHARHGRLKSQQLEYNQPRNEYVRNMHVMCNHLHPSCTVMDFPEKITDLATSKNVSVGGGKQQSSFFK